jgi:phosphopantothenoylcysteine decarboxylase/phosphopantothenate--cysteine ligase
MHLVVTAGPTREHLDPIRFLSNRSTGKMGFALAAQGAARGHEVLLIAGPVALPSPPGVTRVDVVSACEMLEAVQRALPQADALIMAAAVADWRPRQTSPVKLKKRAMEGVLELTPNPDILLTVQPLKERRIFVGFAAETGDPIAEARRKCRDKGVDLIVANDVTEPGAGFAVETNRVTLVPRMGGPEALPLMSKLDVAAHIIAWIERTFRQQGEET